MGIAMKKYTAATMNMILALGVLSLLAGFLFFARIASNLHAVIEPWTVVMMIAGAVVFYLSLTLLPYAVLFFLGLYACFEGALFMFISSGILKEGVKGYWPLSVILCGFCILVTGIAKDRRIRNAFLFPTLLLVLMGSFFLLFSLDIIKMSFSRFFAMWWPLIPVGFGAALIAIFMIQRNPQAHFPYEIEYQEEEGEVKE